LSEPNFSEALLEREKISLLQKLKTRVDRPSAVAFKEFSKLIFKGSLYARDNIGTEQTIVNLKSSDLQKFFEQIKKQKRVYSVVGNLSQAQVNEVVESIESVLEPANGKSLFDQASDFKRKGAQASELPSEKNQTHIIMGYPGFKFADEEKLHLELLSSLLGGQGGRLFIELRDKASLAYSVAPLEYSGLFGGYFGGYIACDPSKKELAVKMMRDEFKKLTEQKLTSQEMDWMKKQVLGNFAMSSQKNSFLCDNMLFDQLYGLDPFTFRKLEERLNKVTEEDLMKTVSAILSGPEFLVSVG
jgi:zinc protease